MRFAHLIAVTLGLTLSACDELPKITMPGSNLACCCGMGQICPTPAALPATSVTPPAAMGPEATSSHPVRRVSNAVRRHRAHGVLAPVQVNRMAETGLSGGVQQVVLVERHEHHEQAFSRSDSWSEVSSSASSSASHGYEEDCDCGPRPAAGRDPSGFLTWPGKAPGRP